MLIRVFHHGCVPGESTKKHVLIFGRFEMQGDMVCNGDQHEQGNERDENRNKHSRSSVGDHPSKSETRALALMEVRLQWQTHRFAVLAAIRSRPWGMVAIEGRKVGITTAARTESTGAHC